MSATSSAAATGGQVPGQSSGRAGAAGYARIAVFAVIGLDFLVLATGSVILGTRLLDAGLDILAWTCAVAVVGFAAIQTPGGAQLGMDMPVLLAAGFVLGPIPAGVIALAGYIDFREFKGQIAWHRALFNRAQTSLCVVAASGVYLLVAESARLSPRAAVGALLAVGVDCLLNYVLVGGVMALNEGVPPRVSIARLRLGPVVAFASTYASFGLLSLLLAETYLSVGGWSLLLFATPLVLARQALSAGQQLEGAEHRLRVQRKALTRATNRIADERRDERLTVAAGLHDDVLPPIFKVHLLGHVLKQELASGQLLAMEDDLPALLRATDEASETLRDVIGSLRSSPIGVHGLAGTLRLLVRQLESESTTRFDTEIEEARAAPVVELLAYQVAREALRNAVRHSDASRISVSLVRESESIRLIIADDGRGFSYHLVDDERHFGLALMRERVELAGGILRVEASSASGTRVVVRLPATDPIRA